MSGSLNNATLQAEGVMLHAEQSRSDKLSDRNTSWQRLLSSDPNTQ